ncbi:MAG: hypothetical protein HKN08_11985, partial [Gammaproteobacteria bacterium]|nr:hypothetical protein [Gammaproteobacteria bacterium]
MINITIKQFALVFCLAIAISSFAEDNPQLTPESTVEHFHANLLDIMKNATAMGYQVDSHENAQLLILAL